MEFQQLKGFFYTVRYGSLTRAAEKMSITQSAVSQQIKSLETELDIHLFNRVGPRKNLTADGKIFFDLISPLVQDIDSLKITFDDLKGTQRGLLTIAVSTVVIMNYLPEIIKKFTESYPKISLVILERRWNETISLTQSGEVDFGITPIVDIPGNLDLIPLEQVDRVLITCRDHPLSKKKNVTLLDVAQYPLITYEKGLVSRDEIDQVFNEVKLDVEVIIEATNSETIKKYVELGIGVAIIPKIALTTHCTNTLEAIPISDQFGKSQHGILLRPGIHITTWARNFLNLLSPSWEKHLKEHQENRMEQKKINGSP